MDVADKPTLYVCHGDDGGPKVHPCRRVQEAMRAKGVEYDKVVAAHGSPIPFLRKGSRDELEQATGARRLPALKLARRHGDHPLQGDPALGRRPVIQPSSSVSRPRVRPTRPGAARAAISVPAT